MTPTPRLVEEGTLPFSVSPSVLCGEQTDGSGRGQERHDHKRGLGPEEIFGFNEVGDSRSQTEGTPKFLQKSPGTKDKGLWTE